MKQVHIFISGNVQGVGYRYFIKSAALQNGIAGWAKNLPGGRVEAVLQGEEKALEKVLEKCRKGPFLAEVKDLDSNWEEVTEALGNFEVR